METQTKTKFSLNAVRRLYAQCGEYKNEFRELLESECLADDEDVLKLVKSLNQDYITIKVFLKGYFLTDDYFYNEDEYTTTREGSIAYTNDANYCEHFEEYTNEDTFKVYIGRGEYFYCQDAIDNLDLLVYGCEYYDNDALSRNDLVVMPNGDIENLDNVYYWESDGEYHYETEDEGYTRDYHSNTNVRFVEFTTDAKFFIGYEIEKEDQGVKESMNISEFEDNCPKWRKERDGSLDDESGYELISPAFELCPDKIEEAIRENKTLLKHINASIDTDTCGGHINVSEKGLSGEELFAKIEGYTPLFHALYYKRINKNYSKGKSNKDLKEQNEKYQSVRIHRNHLEYRIISAVPNIDTLMWRTRLFELILNNPTPCPKIAFFNAQTILKEHLSIMYQNGRFDRLSERIIEFTNTYEGIKLTINNNN